MTNLDIRININTLLYYSKPWESTVGEKTLLVLTKSFAEYIRILYIRMIREAMDSPRYKGHWEPVEDEGYREYIGTEACSDILSLIIEALSVSKVGKNYIIQFDPTYRYPGSPMTLIRVLRGIECGTSDFHSRPILVTCNRRIRANLRELWIGYLTLRGVI